MSELTEQQAQLLGLLAGRPTPGQVAHQLGVSPQRMHRVLNALRAAGWVRDAGELPQAAVASRTPTVAGTVMWADAQAALLGRGYTEAQINRVVDELSRVGASQPRPKDARYSLVTWSGQVERRVRWGSWVVQGLLVPRPDDVRSRDATPDYRMVMLWDFDDLGSEYPVGWWPSRRGRWLPAGEVRDELPGGVGERVVAGLSLCAAWVLEAPAVFDDAALAAWTMEDKK